MTSANFADFEIASGITLPGAAMEIMMSTQNNMAERTDVDPTIIGRASDSYHSVSSMMSPSIYSFIPLSNETLSPIFDHPATKNPETNGNGNGVADDGDDDNDVEVSDTDENTTKATRPQVKKRRKRGAKFSNMEKKKRKQRTEMISKRRITILQKIATYIRDLKLPMLIVTQDPRGKWEYLGTDELEKKLLEGKPIINCRREEMYYDESIKALSLDESTLPPLEMPEVVPSCLTNIPVAAADSSTLYNPKTPTKPKNMKNKQKLKSEKTIPRKDIAVSPPKKTTTTKCNRLASKKSASATGSGCSGSASATRDKKKSKVDTFKNLVIESSDKMDACPICKIKWTKGTKSVICGVCWVWYCRECSKTDKIPDKLLLTQPFTCSSCLVGNNE